MTVPGHGVNPVMSVETCCWLPVSRSPCGSQPCAGSREEAVRDTDSPNSSMSVADSVWSPVSRFTGPGPTSVEDAASPFGSTFTVIHWVE
jgi:hypothetical protein